MLEIIIIVFALAGFSLYRVYSSSDAAKDKAENMQAGNDFLAANKTVAGVITTESGLQYQVLQVGSGTVHPTAKDRVKVDYEGTFIDGHIFDSSIKRGRPAQFGVSNVIKGWTEGLQLMVVGEKCRFYIPAKLAYGNRWAGQIPPGSSLIFEVELLAINP